MQDAINFITSLGPEAMTFLAVIIAGYVLRRIKTFPNGAIPLLCVIVGAFLYPRLTANHFVDPRFGNSNTRLQIIGAFYGFVAWMLHNKFVKPLEAKFPALSAMLGETNGDTQTQAPPGAATIGNQVTKTLSIIALLFGLCLGANNVSAQTPPETNSPPISLWDGVKGVLTSFGAAAPTNFASITYGVYAKDAPQKGERLGGGEFLLWNVSANIGMGMGIEAIGTKFFMPSADVTLKLPIHPLTFLGLPNFTVTPYLMAGAATPLGGTQANPVAALTGIGASVDVAHFKGWAASIVGGDNYWSGAGDYSGQHYYGGFALRRGF